jgi:hypothetical protein
VPDVSKQYIVCPGLYPSASGTVCYLSAPELMRLYHVEPEACFILESGELPTDLPLTPEELSTMLYLFPNSQHQYTHPGKDSR